MGKFWVAPVIAVAIRRKAEGGAPGHPLRNSGGGEGFPDPIASSPLRNTSNRPGPPTMPECCFNISTTPVIDVSYLSLSFFTISMTSRYTKTQRMNSNKQYIHWYC
jgi:hypothetical protein